MVSHKKELYNALYKSLTEAMTNVNHHAYEKNQSIEKRWWCFSQLKDKMLTIIFCDLGLGIPFTVKDTHKEWYKNWSEKVIIKKDGKLLKSLIEKPRSSTGKEHRGKGIKEIMEITEFEKGKISIFSNKGAIFADYNKDKSKAKMELQHKDYKKSINGTMILISIPCDYVENKKN